MNEAQRAFEKWHKRKFPEIPVEWQEHLGRYFYGPVQTRWAAYAAGAADENEACAKLIDESTGPTGGWLDSPKTVFAAIRALEVKSK